MLAAFQRSPTFIALLKVFCTYNLLALAFMISLIDVHVTYYKLSFFFCPFQR